MVLMHIDLNVNSLPIAAAGAEGVGVDYGVYRLQPHDRHVRRDAGRAR